jgi:hypothetical protein
MPAARATRFSSAETTGGSMSAYRQSAVDASNVSCKEIV